MSNNGSHQDFEHFDDWESFTLDDDIYAGTETDLLEEWEDDGAIAQVREEFPIKVGRIQDINSSSEAIDNVELDDESAEVFSLLERAQAKHQSGLQELSGPSMDELHKIEEVGIDDYIDIVLAEDSEDEVSSEQQTSSPSYSGDEGSDGYALRTPSHAERNVQEHARHTQTHTTGAKLNSDLNDFFDTPSQPLNDFFEDTDNFDFVDLVKEEKVDVQLLDLTEGEEGAAGIDEEVSGAHRNDDAVMSIGEDEVELVVQPLFEGLACALPTLFDEEGDVEYKTTARLAKRLSESKVNAIFLATREGEGGTLSRKERKNLVRDVVKSTDGIVIVDVTAASIRQSVQYADDCADAGAKAFVMALDSSVRDPYALCEALHSRHREAALFVRLEGESVAVPIAPEFLYDLPISGVVDATGDAAFFLHLMSVYSGPVYVGSTALIALGNIMGAAGVVLASVTINAELVSQAFAGDARAQAELAMWERECGGANARSIKIALESEFLISSTMRD
ncbi:MAG TPA: dihydrodipicolinate synthase family protein [Acidimicrobiia bacterium]|nr:dihydrodipicolinate synthase family protein [Acidimicrobiia bacterium]